MLKTLTLRSILTYAVLDLLFAPFVILAFTQLLGTGGVADSMLTLAGLTVAKSAVWAVYLNIELAPWERLARATAKNRTPELVQRADRCLQSSPVRFSTVLGRRSLSGPTTRSCRPDCTDPQPTLRAVPVRAAGYPRPGNRREIRRCDT